MRYFNIALASYLFASTAFATNLTDTLVSAYQNNPELIAAREQLKTVDEQMSQAISGFLPSIAYTARKTNSKQDTVSTTSAFGTSTGQSVKTVPWASSKSKASSIQLKQNIFSGGQSVMAVQIAKYSIEAARANLMSVEQQIFLQTIQAYLNVIQTKRVLEINKENVTFYEQKLEAVKQETEAGVRKISDLAEAEAAKANAHTQLMQATGDYDEALASYNKMVGMPAENLTSEASLVKIPTNQMEFIQNTLKNNPDIISISFQQKAADINVISNAANLLPSVDIGGSIDKQWSYSRVNNINQPYTNAKSVYIEVKVPIYQQGTEYSKVRTASAKAAGLKYTVKNTKADVNQKAVQVWSRYNTAKESMKSSEEAVKAGVAALSGLQHEYQEGVTTLTNVITAQENLYRYQISLAQAKSSLELNGYAIASSMGALNAKALALPTKIYNMSANYDRIKIQLIGF